MTTRQSHDDGTGSDTTRRRGWLQRIGALFGLSSNAAAGSAPDADDGAAAAAPMDPLVEPGPPQVDRGRLLDETRAQHAALVQRMDAVALEALKGTSPPWMQSSDALHQVLVQQELLLTKGRIVWAGLVQANRILFSPGDVDSAAGIVHSDDPYFDDHPLEMHRIAQTYYSFKNTEPTDPALKEMARRVTDERTRQMGTVADGVFSHRPLRDSTIVVFRRHLPTGVLLHGLLPLLTHPSTPAVMILPEAFWPEEMVQLWKAQIL
ncbi:hypothetical protein ACQ859_25110 [Roseateles chitinivorans]|uniref:hypothetical protein n=1 Tax=Roseateles chitinivorans TaxID=2917965 RepID=UPI003D676CA7